LHRNRGLDELQVKILEARIAAAKLAHETLEVPAAVVAYVASVIRTNGRDLDGAVNRLLAHASLNSAELTIETAELAIRDLVRTPDPKKVKIEDIQKLVASHFNVSREAYRECGAPAPDRHVSVQALDAALAS
jgi:chromosomal replication initiator protein